MSKPLVTADQETAANEGMAMMVEKDVRALVVTTGGKPIGIVTERDIMKKCCLGVSCKGTKLGDIMSKPLISIDVEAPIGMAVEIMVQKNIRRLLVTDKGEITGIVTQKDLLRGTLEAFQSLQSAASMM
jgi:CBS domain-containing protein